VKIINLTREQWIRYGVEHGYASLPFCETHDGGPIADSEGEAFEQGGDPCLVYMRVGNEAEWETDGLGYLELND